MANSSRFFRILDPYGTNYSSLNAHLTTITKQQALDAFNILNCGGLTLANVIIDLITPTYTIYVDGIQVYTGSNNISTITASIGQQHDIKITLSILVNYHINYTIGNPTCANPLAQVFNGNLTLNFTSYENEIFWTNYPNTNGALVFFDIIFAYDETCINGGSYFQDICAGKLYLYYNVNIQWVAIKWDLYIQVGPNLVLIRELQGYNVVFNCLAPGTYIVKQTLTQYANNPASCGCGESLVAICTVGPTQLFTITFPTALPSVAFDLNNNTNDCKTCLGLDPTIDFCGIINLPFTLALNVQIPNPFNLCQQQPVANVTIRDILGNIVFQSTENPIGNTGNITINKCGIYTITVCGENCCGTCCLTKTINIVEPPTQVDFIIGGLCQNCDECIDGVLEQNLSFTPLIVTDPLYANLCPVCEPNGCNSPKSIIDSIITTQNAFRIANNFFALTFNQLGYQDPSDTCWTYTLQQDTTQNVYLFVLPVGSGLRGYYILFPGGLNPGVPSNYYSTIVCYPASTPISLFPTTSKLDLFQTLPGNAFDFSQCDPNQIYCDNCGCKKIVLTIFHEETQQILFNEESNDLTHVFNYVPTLMGTYDVTFYYQGCCKNYTVTKKFHIDFEFELLKKECHSWFISTCNTLVGTSRLYNVIVNDLINNVQYNTYTNYILVEGLPVLDNTKPVLDVLSIPLVDGVYSIELDIWNNDTQSFEQFFFIAYEFCDITQCYADLVNKVLCADCDDVTRFNKENNIFRAYLNEMNCLKDVFALMMMQEIVQNRFDQSINILAEAARIADIFKQLQTICTKCLLQKKDKCDDCGTNP